jgi:hypothetical protein
MDSETAAPSSALSTALIAPAPAPGFGTRAGLLAASDADGARSELGHAAQPVTRNPAELLASLMDFPGSVALAELLEGDPRALASAQSSEPASTRALPTSTLGERLLLDAEARLDSLEPLVLKPLSGRRAPPIPSPGELLFQLAQYGLVTPAHAGADAAAQGGVERSEAAVRRFADDLGAPFRSALGLSLRQAQAHVATLRWEITHDLRALGPRADQLERLDAAVSRSMQAKLGELLDRMEHAAHLTFIRACVHAVEALPEQVDEQALAGWCDKSGWLFRYRERCVRMAKALFGHLRRNLEGLMRAASENDDWMGDP